VLPLYHHLVYVFPTNASLVDVHGFIADDDYELVSASEIHTTAGTDAGAVSLDIKKCVGTEAPASGVTMLTSPFNLKATTHTVQHATLTTTGQHRKLTRGDRLAFDFIGTLTAVAGVTVRVTLKRV
jgi:hypothetical protein